MRLASDAMLLLFAYIIWRVSYWLLLPERDLLRSTGVPTILWGSKEFTLLSGDWDTVTSLLQGADIFLRLRVVSNSCDRFFVCSIPCTRLLEGSFSGGLGRTC